MILKNKKIPLLILLVLFFGFLTPMESTAGAPRLVDEGDVLSSSEHGEILRRLDDISSREGFGIAIVVVEDYRTARDAQSISTIDPQIFAYDFFAHYGYGIGADNDGIILMISLDMNDIAVATSGFGAVAFTDAGWNRIVDRMIPDLQAGDFYSSFHLFIDLVDDYLARARAGDIVDVGNMPRELTIWNFVIPLGVGLVLSLAIMMFWASGLKSVRSQNLASNYVRDGSLQIPIRTERFLFRNVVKRPRPKQNSSGGGGIGGSTMRTGSGGGSFGGGSRRF
jgi:uncharacterized protein